MVSVCLTFRRNGDEWRLTDYVRLSLIAWYTVVVVVLDAVILSECRVSRISSHIYIYICVYRFYGVYKYWRQVISHTQHPRGTRDTICMYIVFGTPSHQLEQEHTHTHTTRVYMFFGCFCISEAHTHTQQRQRPRKHCYYFARHDRRVVASNESNATGWNGFVFAKGWNANASPKPKLAGARWRSAFRRGPHHDRPRQTPDASRRARALWHTHTHTLAAMST